VQSLDIDAARARRRQDTIICFLLFHTQKKGTMKKPKVENSAATFFVVQFIVLPLSLTLICLLRYLLLAFLNLGCICIDQISNQINKKRHLVASISTNYQ